MPAAPHATAPLQRIECGREITASDKLRTSRLLSCIDQSGEVHTLLLKARPAAEFNPLKEAVAAQALRQAAALVTGPKGLGPASSPQLIASHVLPLAPAARGDGGFVASALVHYRSTAFNLEAWLAKEHTAAHAAGIDAVPPPVASRMFSDAACGAAVGVASGKADGADAATIWSELRHSTRPVLHRLLLQHSRSAEAWAERRECFSRSVAAGCIAGWVVGLGDRAPRSLLYDAHSGQLLHTRLHSLLDTARTLPLPEEVPFRLTRELQACAAPTAPVAPTAL